MTAEYGAGPSFEVTLKWVFGRYEPKHNILYSGCPKPTSIVDAKDMRALFQELHGVIRRCPMKPALFVDFENVRFDPALGVAYREALTSLLAVVENVYRYNVARDLTGTLTSSFVRTANVAVKGQANVYATRELALDAYLASKKK